MKKLCSFLALFFFVVACNKDGASTDCNLTNVDESVSNPSGCTPTDNPTSPVTDVGENEGPSDGGTPSLATTFDTNITLINFSDSQEEKILRAIEIVKLVVASEEFKDRVINHTYNGNKTFVDNGGYSNEEIYQMILEGAETLRPEKNNTMDVEVEMYTNILTSTVGYTYSNSKRIWMNTKFFNQYTAAGVAHNLFHEWLHKLGFTHASSYSLSRDYSVPYAIGDIVGELGEAYL